jgi:PAS domain S-box-containing protein
VINPVAKKENNPSSRYNIIWLGFLIGFSFYITDVLIEVFVFHSGSLQEKFFHPTYHEVWVRTGVFLVAIAFAIYVQLLLRREHEASERAKTAENFLNSIFDNIPSMVFIKDADELRFVRVNQTGEKLLGLSSKELIGKNDYDFFPESQAEFFVHKDREVLAAGIEVNIPEEEIDTVNLGKRWLHTRKVPLLDDRGQPIYLLGISEDITEAKQAEEKILRQQRELAHVMRLSTMGEMASGMAHELNQPLTALVSYCDTAEKLANTLPSSPSQLGEILGRATKQAYRASQIIKHLRKFLDKESDHRESVDIDQVIEGVIDFIKPELKSGQVSVEHHSGTQGCEVMATRVQIEQVLVNLVLNSLEAIKDTGKTTGKIIVRTRLLPNQSIDTTVSDNGPGIAADMIGRMFHPFQTSKPSGMGMGLAISSSIIEAHGGKLWVDEQNQDGAVVGFSLPAFNST